MHTPQCLHLLQAPGHIEKRTIMSENHSSLHTLVDGFCMALADSVPGVSGGTVAFILGFYDRFIGSIHDLVFARGGQNPRRKAALAFLGRLAVGWLVGMALAALVLTSIFEQHIYAVCSLFLGFVIAAIPLITSEEWETIRGRWWGLGFVAAGAILVVVVVSLGDAIAMEISLEALTPLGALYVFLAGFVAIAAMFLPGISGSTILLVLGLYIPIMEALRQLLALDLTPLVAVLVFIAGAAVGAATVVKGIRLCLERHRAQTVCMILGMMVGSLYAIVLGPTTLDIPQPPMDLASFNLVAFLAGIALIAALQYARRLKERSSARI